MDLPRRTGFERLTTADGIQVSVVATDGPWTELEIRIAAGVSLDLRLEVPLKTGVGYWHPNAGAERTLEADWAGHTSTSLVSGAPVGCLHDAAGRNVFAWALDELIDELEVRYGISEERKTFAVELHGQPADAERRLGFLSGATGETLAASVARLADWLAGRLTAIPLSVPAVARRPVYSTWYTFTQDLEQEQVAAETALAVQLGCGSVFVDDGWQRLAVGRGYAGCGDWIPDTDKFPDLAGFSADVHDQGAGVVLWIAPLLLGRDAEVFDTVGRFAPHEAERLHCHILDPRHREVREHLAATCTRLVVDYALEGLKIDFLDTAMVYRGTPSSGDIDDVGEAMQALLALIREQLEEAGHGDAAVEFRQPYVSPAIGAYGQILRASDCPADAVANRRKTIDARLLAVGQVVHGDMLMWGPSGGPEAVAQQLYGCWFAVPQISMALASLDREQAEALAGLLALWQEHVPVVLDGTLEVRGSERAYDLVRADRADLQRSVIARYAPVVVDVDLPGETTIMNATAEDSVVVRLAAGRSVSGGTAHSAAAAIVGEVGALTGRLHDVPVPPYGSLTLVVVADPS
ncbi:MAG TPA: glycoside hydrolase family 36 protein [Microlunatus sp.]